MELQLASIFGSIIVGLCLWNTGLIIKVKDDITQVKTDIAVLKTKDKK